MSIEYTKEVSDILQRCSDCSSKDLENFIRDLRKLALAVIRENRELRERIKLLEKK